jgi:hypothetical protein
MSNENELNTLIMNELIQYCKLNPRNLTHIGIGTAPRTNKLDDFISRIDQIMPVFVDLDLFQTVRIIHFDSRFNDYIDFLHEYFDSKDIPFKYDDSEGMHIWRSHDNTIEVIINSFNFYHSNHNYMNFPDNYDWFLEKLIKYSLDNNNKMIVQEYTGGDTSHIFKILYDKSTNKSNFKKHILFDVSYGNNHCDIDMNKYKPIYTKDGDFINIMLMNINELRDNIDYHPMIREHVEKYYIGLYREIINTIPVDFRRKMLTEAGRNPVSLMSYKNMYTIESSYEQIIEVLKQELIPIIQILKEIKFMTSEKEDLIKELLSNYKNYTLDSKPDIYKWSEGFSQISKYYTNN